MSVNAAQEPSGVRQWETADEIDLNKYAHGLVQRWPEILIIVIAIMAVTAAGVLFYRQVTPPVYESTATAAIVRTSTDVRFDERFTTSSDQPNLDVNSRRAALVGAGAERLNCAAGNR